MFKKKRNRRIKRVFSVFSKIRKKIRRKKRKKQLKRFFFRPATLSIFVIIFAGLFAVIFYSVFLSAPDNRYLRIDTYFSKHDAPLAGHGHTFVKAADSCGMDWRLLPAIAMQESSGGKHMQYNNPFGWGGAQIPFESIDEAIMNVGWNLCGNNVSTTKWYSTTSTYEKLHWYNGTVQPTYPNEVMWIMDQI